MAKLSLLYLQEKDVTVPAAVIHWPEIDSVEVIDTDRFLRTWNGAQFDVEPAVVSLAADDEDGLLCLDLMDGVHCVAIRGDSYGGDWGTRLQAICNRGSIIICPFNRHSVVSALGRKAYWDGIELLQVAAEYLRGPGVQASSFAMKTETNLTRAIESLCTSGYRTDR